MNIDTTNASPQSAGQNASQEHPCTSKDLGKDWINTGELTLAQKTARMGRLINRYYMASSRAHGSMAGNVLRGQGRVLALLKNKPQTTQRELQYVLDMRQQSLSELLAKLEEKGYITRSKSPDDGRVTLVALTEAGVAAAPDVDAMASQADALDCLEGEDRAQFELYVDRVTASLVGKLNNLGIDPDAPRHDPHSPGGRGGHGPCGPQGRGGHHPHGGHGEHGRHHVTPYVQQIEPRGDQTDSTAELAQGPKERHNATLKSAFEAARRAADNIQHA